MLKDRTAARYLADLACETLFQHPGPMPWVELAHNVGVRLPVAPDVLGEELEADERFTAEGGRWDLVPRVEAAGRPLVGALQALLECLGKPLPRTLLISELCLSRPGDPLQTDELLRRLLTTTRDFGEVGDCLYPSTWLPRLGPADDQALLFLNDLSEDAEFRKLRPKLLTAAHKQRQVLDTAAKVLKTAGMLGNRALGLILRAHHGDRFDPAETLGKMLCDERFICLSGPVWALRVQEAAWRRAVLKAGEAESARESVVDIAQILDTPPTQRMKLDAATQQALRAVAATARTAVSADELVRGVLELRPRQRNFAPAVHAVDHVLRHTPTLVPVRRGRYLPQEGIPAWVRSLPAALAPQPTPGGDVPLEELPADLAALVTDPFREDVGDAAVILGEEETEARVVIPWHHHRCGTMKLRRCDHRLLDLHAPIATLTLLLPDGRSLPVWANSTTQLLYGLLSWYAEALPATGAVLTLRQEPGASDEFAIAYDGEADSAAHVSEERLEQLLHLAARFERRPSSLAEILAAVLQPLPKGLAFDPLWYQLNIVRRTTRLQLASALVRGTEQFAQTSGRWHSA
jgi:hypothetical protein